MLHGKGGSIVMSMPFEKDTFLFDTYVAGTAYIEGIEGFEPPLSVDEKLDFFREPNNNYDEQAIVIKTTHGVKIGYVPRKDNIFSRLMDVDKLLFSKILHKKKRKMG